MLVAFGYFNNPTSFQLSHFCFKIVDFQLSINFWLAFQLWPFENLGKHVKQYPTRIFIFHSSQFSSLENVMWNNIMNTLAMINILLCPLSSEFLFESIVKWVLFIFYLKLQLISGYSKKKYMVSPILSTRQYPMPLVDVHFLFLNNQETNYSVNRGASLHASTVTTSNELAHKINYSFLPQSCETDLNSISNRIQKLSHL